MKTSKSAPQIKCLQTQVHANQARLWSAQINCIPQATVHKHLFELLCRQQSTFLVIDEFGQPDHDLRNENHRQNHDELDYDERNDPAINIACRDFSGRGTLQVEQ